MAARRVWRRRGNFVLRGRAAVDHEHLAGDERASSDARKERQAADVVGLAQPGDRLLAHELLAPRLVFPEIGTEVGLDQTRGQRIDADAVLCRTRVPRTGSS